MSQTAAAAAAAAAESQLQIGLHLKKNESGSKISNTLPNKNEAI